MVRFRKDSFGHLWRWAVVACCVTGCGTHSDIEAERANQADGRRKEAGPPPTQVVVEVPDDPYAEPLVPAIDLGGGGGAGGGFGTSPAAMFHAHGEEVCASGCAASRHPTPELTDARFRELLLKHADARPGGYDPALDELLYSGRQVLDLLDRLGGAPLTLEDEARLRRELTRDRAEIQFRIVDETGAVRVRLAPTEVPLDRRHVFRMTTENLPDLETSGTVKRVGLHHLWTRL